MILISAESITGGLVGVRRCDFRAQITFSTSTDQSEVGCHCQARNNESNLSTQHFYDRAIVLATRLLMFETLIGDIVLNDSVFSQCQGGSITCDNGWSVWQGDQMESLDCVELIVRQISGQSMMRFVVWATSNEELECRICMQITLLHFIETSI